MQALRDYIEHVHFELFERFRLSGDPVSGELRRAPSIMQPRLPTRSAPTARQGLVCFTERPMGYLQYF